jgi:hypothetical protein
MRASLLTCELLNCFDHAMREEMYQRAERDYGKGFSDHLRDTVEAHHLIVANERGAVQQEGDGK